MSAIIRIGDVLQRSGGGYYRGTRAEQAANYIADLGWPLGEPPSSGPGAYPIQLTDNFWGSRHHAGLDVPARVGTPIRAPIAGTVIRARRGADEGNYIAIEDARGRRHYFLHMRAPTPLQVGARVTKGQQIGEVGSTGRSDGPHLHYAIILPNNHVIDPYPMLVAARMRENPPGVAGVGLRVVGDTAEEWRTLEILVERMMARVNGWTWPQAVIDSAPDPSERRTMLRQLREGKQAQMRAFAEAFRLRRARHEFAPAQQIVRQMQETWGNFEAFARSAESDANATYSERATQAAHDAGTAAANVVTTAAANIGAGIFVVALAGVGIFAAVAAATRAHGARAA